MIWFGKKVWRLLLFLLMVLMIVVFLSPNHSRNNGSVSYVAESDIRKIQTYNSNKELTTVSVTEIPARVIANRINCEETLIALGVESRIVAANMQNTDWNKAYLPEYKQAAQELNAVTYKNLTFEEALALNPDCIIGWRSTFSTKNLGTTDFWNARGVVTYISATSNQVKKYAGIKDECQYILDMGRIFRKEEQAQEIVSQINQYVVDIQNQVAYRYKPSVMVIEFQGPIIVNYGIEWLVGDMVSQLGGRLLQESGRLDYESLISANPDVIFVVYFNTEADANIQKVINDPKFNSLKAVREQRVYPIRLDYMYTTAVRTVNGLEILKSGMYPDLQ